MQNVPKWLQKKLYQRKEQGNYRTLKTSSSLIDFSSNDYLGLAKNQQLRATISEAIENRQLPNGATGSRLLTGNHPVYHQLEQHLADFFKAPAALLFNSGYTANLALISTVPQRGDTVLYDKSIHACIKDGSRLSTAKCLSFSHNDSVDLDKKLAKSEGNKYVVIESLYSMDGDYPPADAILKVARKHQAYVIVDEAHTTGWLGPRGSGWAVDQGIDKEIFSRVHTFGKAFGLHGACVVGSQELIDYLINFSRPFIFTTAMTPHAAVSIDCALTLLKQEIAAKEQLLNNIEYYLQQVSNLDLNKSVNSNSPIQWILTPGNQMAINISEHLKRMGLEVFPILSPTVPEGKERLRICLHAFNTREQISALIQAISDRI